MSLTNRNVASILIALMAGIALWVLPNHVRSDNTLFGANGTLLPAIALALILGLSVLDACMSIFFSGQSQSDSSSSLVEDVRMDRAAFFGMLLVTILAGLFALSLRSIGYAPASFVLVLALMLGTGGRNPVTIPLVSTVAVAQLYICLRFGLGVHIQLWPNWAG